MLSRSTAIIVFVIFLQVPGFAQRGVRPPQPQQQPQQPQQPQPKPPVPAQPPVPTTPKPEPPPKPERPPRTVNIPRYLENPEATIERLRKAFSLSDQQVFDLRPLVGNRNRDAIGILQGDGNAASKNSEIRTIQDRFEDEFRRILTAGQTQRFDKEVLARPGLFR